MTTADVPRWGVWCVPTHKRTRSWPEHWWGQFWSTKDRVALGSPKDFDEAGARAEAAKQAKADSEGGYSYEARPLPEPKPSMRTVIEGLVESAKDVAEAFSAIDDIEDQPMSPQAGRVAAVCFRAIAKGFERLAGMLDEAAEAAGHD